MSAVTGAALTASVPKKNRSTLWLSMLGAALLYLGLERWDFEYESPLFLLPFIACIGLVCAIVAALQWQHEQARRTFVDRAALAIGCLALLAPGATVFFHFWHWKGVFACLPYVLVLLLPLRARSSWWPLALGSLAIVGGPAAYGLLGQFEFDQSDSFIACLLSAQLVALLGIALGSAALARGTQATVRIGYGLALDVLVIGGPLIWLILHLFSED